VLLWNDLERVDAGDAAGVQDRPSSFRSGSLEELGWLNRNRYL